MDWANERYVRLYTRDTATMVAIGWEGRAVFFELLRKVDRSGVLDHGGDTESVPDLLRIPKELFLTGLARLLKKDVIATTETSIVVVNFMKAQESAQSDKARKQAERERRRAEALATVTPGHAESRPVTDGHEMSLCAEPSLSEPLKDMSPSATVLPFPDPPPEKSRAVEAKLVTASVVGAFNRAFGRNLRPSGWEDSVKRLLSKGHTDEEMRGVVWWASIAWAGKPEIMRNATPKTLLKLQSSQGHGTFREYLSCAGELWREKHNGEAPPWEVGELEEAVQ